MRRSKPDTIHGDPSVVRFWAKIYEIGNAFENILAEVGYWDPSKTNLKYVTAIMLSHIANLLKRLPDPDLKTYDQQQLKIFSTKFFAMLDVVRKCSLENSADGEKSLIIKIKNEVQEKINLLGTLTLGNSEKDQTASASTDKSSVNTLAKILQLKSLGGIQAQDLEDLKSWKDILEDILLAFDPALASQKFEELIKRLGSLCSRYQTLYKEILNSGVAQEPLVKEDTKKILEEIKKIRKGQRDFKMVEVAAISWLEQEVSIMEADALEMEGKYLYLGLYDLPPDLNSYLDSTAQKINRLNRIIAFNTNIHRKLEGFKGYNDFYRRLVKTGLEEEDENPLEEDVMKVFQLQVECDNVVQSFSELRMLTEEYNQQKTSNSKLLLQIANKLNQSQTDTLKAEQTFEAYITEIRELQGQESSIELLITKKSAEMERMILQKDDKGDTDYISGSKRNSSSKFEIQALKNQLNELKLEMDRELTIISRYENVIASFQRFEGMVDSSPREKYAKEMIEAKRKIIEKSEHKMDIISSLAKDDMETRIYLAKYEIIRILAINLRIEYLGSLELNQD